MNTLTIKLKQHTPLIHFQHDQDGATLRASEVKPKLDKYILTQLGGGNYEKGKEDARKKGWLVGKGDHPALDYKMRIEAEGRRYEHKINIINANKIAVVFQHIQLTISCPDALQPYITDNLPIFFVANNFGFRQSKGYGSFTVEEMILDGEKKDLSKLNYSESLISSQQYERVCAYNVYIPQCVTMNLNQKKYFDSKVIIREEDRNDKDKTKELNKQCTILVPIEADSFNSQFVFLDYKERIREAIDNRIKELEGNSQSIIKDYLDSIIDGLSKCKDRKLDAIHNDFLYEYFKIVLDKTIVPKYQCYKSGRNEPNKPNKSYEKSHLRDFLGEIKGNTDIVFWDKRFMKQKIDQLIEIEEEIKGLGLKLKDDHRQDTNSGSELYSKDSTEQSYFFVRALLGLEGNFEFQTNDKNKRFVVSVDGNDVERFQSIIKFKVINNVVFTCIKPKEEIKRILNKDFSFMLNVKDTTNRKSCINKPIKLGVIKTPDLNDEDIDKLYKDIKSFFSKE